MSIELIQAAQQALSALEKSQPHPSNPVIGLTNQDFIDHEETISALRTAIQQPDNTACRSVQKRLAAQQATTAIACGIPGMAKTTCPYCEQGFAFEFKQAEAKTPSSKEHLFELWWEAHMPNATQEQAWTAFTAAVASNGVGIAAQHPAKCEPVAWSEREQLRHAQAAVVMPMIGPLLDAWENSDREVMSQEPELSKQLKNINSAMEDADTHQAPSVPKDDQIAARLADKP